MDRSVSGVYFTVLVTAIVLASSVAAPAPYGIADTGSAQTTTIDSCQVIDSPGAYSVTGDLSAAEGSIQYNSVETCLAINSSDVTLLGNDHVITGPNSDYTSDPTGISKGIVIDGPLANVTVESVVVKLWDTGVDVSSATDVAVSSSHVHSNSVNGIAVASSDRVNVSTNHVYTNGWHYAATGDTGNGIYFYETHNSTIYRNGGTHGDISQNDWYGIQLVGSHHNTIDQNNVDQTTAGDDMPRRGILLENANNNTLTGNLVQEALQYGVVLDGADNNTIGTPSAVNTIQDNRYSGLWINHLSNDNVVENNLFDGNGHGGYDQLSITGDGTAIVDNTIQGFDQTDAGLFVNAKRDVVVRGNTISSGVKGVEIYTDASASGIEVLDNVIRSNDEHGVWISADTNVSGVSIHENALYHNLEYGVYNANASGVVNATGNDWGHPAGSQGPGTHLGAAPSNVTDPATGAIANGTGSNVSEGAAVGISNVRFDPILDDRAGPVDGGDVDCSAPTAISSPTTITESGCYVLTADLVSVGADNAVTVETSDITLLGQNHTIAGATHGVFVGEYGAEYQNVTIRNVTVTDVFYGISAVATHDVRIQNVTTARTQYGLWLIGPSAGGVATVSDLSVRGGKSDSYKTVGVDSRNYHLTLDRVTVVNSSTGIDLKARTYATASNVTLDDNEYGALIGSPTNVTIEASEISRSDYAGVQINHRGTLSRTWLKGNNVSANSIGVELRTRAQPSVVSITDNRLTDNGVGMQLAASNSVLDVDVHGNLIAGNHWYGIRNLNASTAAYVNATGNDWSTVNGVQIPGTNASEANSAPLADPVDGSVLADGSGDNVTEGGSAGIANVRFHPVATDTESSETTACIDEAVARDDGVIDLGEIQQAIDWWATDAAVPGTDGETINLSKIQALIDAWATDESVSCT